MENVNGVVFPLWEIDRRSGFFGSSRGVQITKYHDTEELWDRLEQFDTETYIRPSDDRVFLDSKGRRLSIGLYMWDTPEIYRLEVVQEIPLAEDLERMRQYDLPIL